MPDMVQTVAVGHLLFGSQRRPAIRITIVLAESADEETLYLSFDNLADRTRLLADLFFDDLADKLVD